MLSKNHVFFPFSPAFMEELSMEADPHRAEKGSDSESEESIPLVTGSEANVDLTAKIVAPISSVVISDDPVVHPLSVVEVASKIKFLVGIRASSVVHLSGFGNITLLCGQAVVHGYSLRVGEVLPFRSPTWQPTLRVFAPEVNNKASAPITVEGVSNPVLKQLRSQCVAVLLLEGTPKDTQEWMEAAEDQTAFGALPGVFKKSSALSCALVKFSSGCLGTADRVADVLQLSHLPASWSDQADAICDQPQASKVMVCGSKGVGKSTFARYMANRLLSETTAPVFFLNCDLGQPEVSAPGFLALHRLDAPLLSAQHFNLHDRPELSFFLADLTSRKEPDLFLGALQHIATHFTEKAGAGGHLIVNTDGFVRYMGAEVLNAIFNVVQPTHVVHLRSSRHSPMPFRCDPAPFPFQYLSLEEGRSVPARVRAVDLRSLRLAAFFLRHHPLLLPRRASESPEVTTTALQSAGGRHAVTRRDVLDEVSIKSANLVGGERGSLALALLAIAPVLVPLDCVIFNPPVLTPDLAPAMLLGAANMNLVSWALLDEDDPVNTRVQSAELAVSDKDKGVTVHYFPTFTLRPAMGLGFVRAVDLARSVLVLTTPQPVALLSHGARRLVLTCSTSIHLPTAMLTGAAFPVFPYLRAEQAGEGSTPLRARPNKKRKSHFNAQG